jgi:hypothetical protein
LKLLPKSLFALQMISMIFTAVVDSLAASCYEQPGKKRQEGKAGI